ncbi:MAG: aldo/keto reductase, partial [Anaerolineales bacterium]|nr:aldo/keto reductase [Anaerolineales bacterium]
MERRTIPHTSLRVSTLCLGTMTFGTPVAEADAIRLTHAALERGVNFIDTANMYEGYARFVGSPGGVAEEILGKALIGIRDLVVLATKVGMKIGPADDDQGLSRTHILRELDRSLQRLGTGYVDLYYMHKPDPSVPLTESVQAFDELVKAGKVRHWAVSNHSSAQLEELLKVCDANGWTRPVAVQPAYSLLNRAIEADLLPLCVREQIAVLPFRVLEGGMLTGKYQRGMEVPADSRQAEKPEWTLALTDENFARLETLEAE